MNLTNGRSVGRRRWETIKVVRHAPANFPGEFTPADFRDPEGTAELFL
jgi:hypothetical protein